MKTYYSHTNTIRDGLTLAISARGKKHAKAVIDKHYPEHAGELKENLKQLKAGESVKAFSNLCYRKEK